MFSSRVLLIFFRSLVCSINGVNHERESLDRGTESRSKKNQQKKKREKESEKFTLIYFPWFSMNQELKMLYT